VVSRHCPPASPGDATLPVPAGLVPAPNRPPLPKQTAGRIAAIPRIPFDLGGPSGLLWPGH